MQTYVLFCFATLCCIENLIHTSIIQPYYYCQVLAELNTHTIDNTCTRRGTEHPRRKLIILFAAEIISGNVYCVTVSVSEGIISPDQPGRLAVAKEIVSPRSEI